MEGHETMVMDNAIHAVAYSVGTVITQEIADFTTISTKCYQQSISSIVAKHFLKVTVSILEPILQYLSACALFGFLVSFGTTFNGIIILYVGLIFNMFIERVKERIVNFWV
jgi:hypothetical protein